MRTGLSVPVILAFLLFSAAAVQAASPKGTYGGSGGLACLVAPGGFNANLQPLDPAVSWSTSNSHTNIFVLEGGGHGTLQSFETFVTPPPTPGFPPSASSSHGTGTVTYTIDKKNSAILLTISDLKGTVDAGPRAGQTFTVDSFGVAGFFSKTGKFVELSTETPTVETVTYSDGTTLKRLCHRNTVIVNQND
jgi:hypothetical protein